MESLAKGACSGTRAVGTRAVVDTLQNEALVAVAATGARLAQKAAIINDLLGYACPSQQVQVPGSMEARQGGVSSICMLGLLCVECYSREYGRYGEE